MEPLPARRQHLQARTAVEQRRYLRCRRERRLEVVEHEQDLARLEPTVQRRERGLAGLLGDVESLCKCCGHVCGSRRGERDEERTVLEAVAELAGRLQRE